MFYYSDSFFSYCRCSIQRAFLTDVEIIFLKSYYIRFNLLSKSSSLPFEKYPYPPLVLVSLSTFCPNLPLYLSLSLYLCLYLLSKFSSLLFHQIFFSIFLSKSSSLPLLHIFVSTFCQNIAHQIQKPLKVIV